MNRLKIIVLFLALIAVKESLCVEFEGSLSDFVALTPHDKSLFDFVTITSQQSSISNDVFNDCSRLLNLYLNNTGLSNLPQHIFDRLINLQSLQLSGNFLIDLPSNIFDKLKQLRYLFLGSNYFTKLSPCIFKNLRLLNTIGLDGMKDGRMIIQNSLFSGLHNIEHLWLPGDIFFENGKNSFLKMLRSNNPNIAEIVSVPAAVGRDVPVAQEIIMDPIVAEPAVAEVVAEPAVEAIVAGPAVEAIVAEPAVEAIVAADPNGEDVVIGEIVEENPNGEDISNIS